MQRSIRLLLKRSIVVSTLTAVGVIVLFATLGLVQSAMTQTTKRSFESDHPLARGVFVGPTYFTTYDAPLKGSAYRLREEKKP